MTTRVQALRSSTSGALPTAGVRLPGEMFANFPDLQLGVIDGSKNPQKLIAVRFFSASANYAIGDFVIQAGALYVANSAVTAGAFNASKWNKIVIAGDLSTLPYLPIAGGTLTGALTLAADPGAALDAATKQYVDNKASSTAPAMDGIAAVGVGATFARADHVHPTDTSRYAASNPSGYQTAAQVTASLASYLPLAGGTLTGQVTIALPSGNAILGLDTPTAQSRYISGKTNGVTRWNLVLGTNVAEGGSNSGSDLAINRYNDAGIIFGAAVAINRATGVTTFSSAIVNGPSDATLKENIEPLEGALDKVLALQGVSFNMIATPEKREIGLIAQAVEPVVPEVIQTYTYFDAAAQRTDETKLALDYPKLTALLIEAVKTLAARVVELEGAA